MKKLFSILLVLPILSACSAASVTFDVIVDNADLESELIMAATRVIERRMQSIGEEVLDLDIQKEDGFQIYVKAKEQTALEILTDELTSTFEFIIMEETPEEEAEKIVDGHGGFNPTGITGKDIVILTASEEFGGKGRVTISFTEEGREKMADVFKKNKDKSIGIFVRGQLVSKLLVQTEELKDDIVITDIPSYSLAEVFTDDVNVGLHVIFTLSTK